ncbi:MAG: M20/M25/M40 family metallo-hydrolase, partial [Rhodospirillaceae bacterium]|nr:M20/M25/M40 family metallo-hydrolase [Rhodospirillaceae bacterium]
MTAWRLDEAECAELVELLVGLVASPSPDPPGNEAAVAGFLIGWLEERGFDVTRDEFAPDRINVLARLKGDGSKPALIFSAHMDTLPIGDGDWGHPAFGAEIEDGKLYRRGATDMKSG